MKIIYKYLPFIRKYEIIIASCAVLILVILLVFNMLLPNLNRANQIYKEEQNLKKRLDLLSQKNQFLSSLDYQYYKDSFLKSSQILPDSKDYISLISAIDSLEKQSGVSLIRTDFQLGAVSANSNNLVKVPGSAASAMPIIIEVMGDRFSLHKFLDLISGYNGRLMVFDEVSFKLKTGETFDAVFTGRAFYYPLPSTLGSIDSPLVKLEKRQEAILQKISSLNIEQEISADLDKSSIGKKNLFE